MGGSKDGKHKKRAGGKHDRCGIRVCHGASCCKNKSKKLRKRLEELVEERGLEDRVAVGKVSCLGRCDDGLAVKVYPSKKVFTKVKPKKAEEVLDELLGGA